MPTTTIVGETRFLSVHQLAVVAYQYQCCVALFQAFLVQVIDPISQAMWRLLAVSPDMAKLLASVTFSETRLGFVRLYPVAT
jgi:hypothetical protein